MGFHTIAGAAFRALTARKDGPSLYDVCDPVLLKYRGGDPHLGKFYRTALGNPALRPLLRRTGLPALRDGKRLGALQEALRRARDDAEPDWAAVGAPIADLMADIGVNHPSPQPVHGVAPSVARRRAAVAPSPAGGEVDEVGRLLPADHGVLSDDADAGGVVLLLDDVRLERVPVSCDDDIVE